MPESLSQNNHPLNRRARVLLRQVKGEMSPDRVYLVQLVLWGLENEVDGLERDDELIANLWEASPDLVMKRLAEGDDAPLDPHELDNLDPVDAAQRIYEALESQGLEQQGRYFERLQTSP